jgi:hypothetical protein
LNRLQALNREKSLYLSPAMCSSTAFHWYNELVLLNPSSYQVNTLRESSHLSDLEFLCKLCLVAYRYPSSCGHTNSASAVTLQVWRLSAITRIGKQQNRQGAHRLRSCAHILWAMYLNPFCTPNLLSPYSNSRRQIHNQSSDASFRSNILSADTISSVTWANAQAAR